MIGGARALARQRVELVARSAQLRSEIAAAAAPLQAKLAPMDRVAAAARAHPVLSTVAAGAAALLVGRFVPSLSRVLRIALLLARL